MKQMYVYIPFNPSRTLNIGVTSDLVSRMEQHRRKEIAGFTARYNITMLAYYEIHPSSMSAIEREKQLKGWNRAQTIALMESSNPHWDDLSNGLVDHGERENSGREDGGNCRNPDRPRVATRHPERTREGSGLEGAGQMLRGVPLSMTDGRRSQGTGEDARWSCGA